jgi:hypothetical protein
MLPLDPPKFLAATLKPYATGEISGRPGLLERYLLEPGDDDNGAIQRRMDDVKAIWDKSFEHARYGDLAKALAAEHDDASLVLLDPSERSRLAAQAKKQAGAAAEKAAAALADWLTLLREHEAKGGLTPNSRTTLERLGKSAGLDPEVVRLELDRARVAAAPDVMAPEVREQVRKALQGLARDVGEERLALSLYHALGLDGISDDLAVVQRQYEEVDEVNRRRPIGQTASSYKMVLANVKLYLLDADPRAYVEGLILDVIAAMEFDGARAATDGVVDPTEAESLLQTALALGLTVDLARRVVTELARQNDAVVETGTIVDYVACPSCNTPHPRPTAPAACKRCGTALFITCPAGGCGTRNDATALRCSACQTDLYKYAEAIRRLGNLPEAVDGGRIGWAGSELDEIARVLGVAAIPADLRGRIEQRVGDAELAWSQAEAAIAGRRLYEARTTLRGLAGAAGDVLGPTGDRPAVRAQEVERRLAEVDAALARARATTGAAREAALIDAIDLAEDCEEAARALAGIPPEPPGAVSVELGAGGPVVTWLPSETSGARYLVRRIVAGSNETTDLASSAATRCEDHDAPTGATVRYDVLTLRGRATSVAVHSTPLMVAREVQGLAVADADGEVRLSWHAVPASARVVVKRSAERSGQTSDLIADRTGLVDRDVVNDDRYAYHVVVEYGGTQRTRGVTIYGQPAAPPESIDQLRIRALPGGAVQIGFDRPPSGTVSIIRCAEEPSVTPGDPLDPGGLAAFGRLLPVGTDGARDDGTASGLCWYLPVTVAGGSAIAGRPVRHLALADILNVCADQTPGQLRVTWEWPPDVRIAKVVWRTDRQPQGPDEPGAESAWVRLGEYRDNGGFTIATAGPAPVFLAVMPAIRLGGDLVAGTSIAKGSRAAVSSDAKAHLRYAVRRTGMRKKRLEIEVDAPDGVTPPSLVLVARSGDLLPRTAGEGDVLARLGGGEPLSSSVDLSGRARPLAVRLFLESASSAASFQLSDPGADDLLIR